MGKKIYLVTRDVDLGYMALSAWTDEQFAVNDLERIYAIDLRANPHTDRRHYNVEQINVGKAYDTAALEAHLKKVGN